METSLIPGIRKAIQNDKTLLYDIRTERDYVMPLLRKAKFISTHIVDLIERQYVEKINKLENNIIEMGSHLIELEGNKHENQLN